MQSVKTLVIVVAAALLAACTAMTPPGQPTPDPPPTARPAATGSPPPDGQTRPPIGTPPVVPVPETPAGVVGEVPQQIMEALVDETAALAQVPLADVRVTRAEAVTWRDGSLGCPEPGMVYTLALVDGYWVMLEVGDQTYDWRMGESGLPGAVLCPAGQGEPPFEDLPD